jgi:hypothetical protein
MAGAREVGPVSHDGTYSGIGESKSEQFQQGKRHGFDATAFPIRSL